MLKSGKSKLAVLALISISLYISLIEVEGAGNNLLDTIVAGVAHNNSAIKNISFDYVVDYNVSEEWRNKQLEFMMSQGLPVEMELRIPTLERTLRTGSATFEGNKFKIASKKTALSDQKVFEDKLVACDSVTLRGLNLKQNVGYICDVNSATEGDLMFDPRNFPVLFVDGQSLQSALTAEKTTISLLGTEEIDGTKCHIIEIVKTFMTPEGGQKQVRRKCWIAPDKCYLVRKAISYDVKSPDKPLNITQSELTEVLKGIWYYSKVTFQSYPSSSPKPDVIAVLQLGNIVVNQKLKEKTFMLPFPDGCLVDDQVSRVRYRVGSPLEKLRRTLDQLVDETEEK